MITLKSAEHRIPKNHPLRFIKGFVDSLLDRLSPVFDEIYAEGGQPSIPPEWLLKASLLGVDISGDFHICTETCPPFIVFEPIE